MRPKGRTAAVTGTDFNRIVAIGFVTLLLAACAAPSLAASYIVPTDEVLIGKADVIVRGRVLDVASIQDPFGGIHTDITVALDRVLKGAPDRSMIVVRQPGGHVRDTYEFYAGIGSFAPGDDVLLMLDAPEAAVSGSADVPFRVTDFAVGNFTVLKNPNGQEFLRREGLREAFVLSSASLSAAPAQTGSSSAGDPDRDAAAFEIFIGSVVKGALAPADYVLPQQQTSTDRIAGFVFLGTPPARRVEFDAGGTVTYTANSAGDNGTACGLDHCLGAVAAGVVKWNDTPSTLISLAWGGSDPTIGSKCLNALNNQIQFNDPCNEISNLNGCSGTLALGGFQSSTQSGGTPYCPAMGNPSFHKIMVAKLLVNNGVGACLNACDFTEMIAHETGHTIGAGHTNVPNSLMNPTLHQGHCGLLAADDMAFAQCAYPHCQLKVSRFWTGPAPATITFSSHAVGSSPFGYTYTFGDGQTSSKATSSYTYTAPGTYDASVTIIDSLGRPCTDDRQITVQTCKPAQVNGVTARLVSGIWRAVVLGKGFKAGSRVEIDTGSGFVAAPGTSYISSTKVVGKNVATIWPAGTPASIHVVNPNGCVSNQVTVTR